MTVWIRLIEIMGIALLLIVLLVVGSRVSAGGVMPTANPAVETPVVLPVSHSQ